MKNHLTIRGFVFTVFLAITLNTSAQMEKSISLNHVAVYVFDLKKSTDFYKDILGLTVIPEPFHDGRHTWFKVGEHSQLHIIQGAKSIMEHDKDNHLCFSVSSIDDFIVVLNRNNIWFGNFGGEKDKITIRPDGIKQIYFKDPDGYWIEINNDPY